MKNYRLKKSLFTLTLVMTFIMMNVTTAPLFAQVAKMESLAETIANFFKGPIVKTILIMCLCGTAIAYGFNKDNEKMKRNCIAIAVAIAILGAASFIVGEVWKAAV
jgi:type IV secretory pathway VirB2 component (pilin)